MIVIGILVYCIGCYLIEYTEYIGIFIAYLGLIMIIVLGLFEI